MHARSVDGRRVDDAEPNGAGGAGAVEARTEQGGRTASVSRIGATPGDVTRSDAHPIDVGGDDPRLVDGRAKPVHDAVRPTGDVLSSPDAPRISAAEADQRFEALIAQYRATKPRRTRPSARGLLTTRYPYELVFLVGIAAGLVMHARPLTALVLGIPVFIVVRLLAKRVIRVGDADGD